MAETAITAVLSKFGELTIREAAVLLQVGDDIMLLRDKLEWLQAFIRDADRKRRAGTDDGLTRVWVRQTRDVAFDVEDALDDFFHKVALKSLGCRGWKTWPKYLTGWRSQITIRHGLSGRITEIRRRLKQILEDKKEFNIEHTPSRIWTSSTIALAWDDVRRMDVGIDDNKNRLRNLLLDNDSHDQNMSFFGWGRECSSSPQKKKKMFISVLGESGSGKYTLVDHVYAEMRGKKRDTVNNEMVDNFQVVVWYNMPPDSSTRDVLKQIHKKAAKQVRPQNGEVEGTNITDKLRKLLGGVKYLVVLSGMSSKAMLNCVEASLPDDKNGSRVVIILELDAHGDELAKHAENLNQKRNKDGVNRILKLSRWDKKRSWDLFHSVVDSHSQAQTEKEAEEEYDYKEKVHAITRGHPLSIVVLAGFLRHKEKPAEWKALIEQLNPASGPEGEKQEVQEVECNPQALVVLVPAAASSANNERKAILSMRMAMKMVFTASYDDLPQDLKSCFLYLAAYPNNITHSAKEIVRMWMAEGFIKPRKGKTLEELGHMHLRELVSRCLVERLSPKADDGIVSVRVHACLLEFLQSEARQASFIEVHDKNDVLAPASVRRLSIQNDGHRYTPLTNKFPKLRSFICRVDDDAYDEEEEGELRSDDAAATCSCKSSSSMLSCICVIPRLCPAREEPRGHHHDIKFLLGSKLLRLISLQGLRLEELPSEIGDMIHLRYLRVDCKGLKVLPSSIKRLLNLQTLDIRNTEVEKIHWKFWKIESLRHVLADKLRLPVSLELELKLGELQTLHGVHAPDEGWNEGNCPLHKMTKLRSLEMYGFTASKHELAFQSALKNMHLLGHLKLQGDKIPYCLFTEPGLLYLQSMVLFGDITWPKIAADALKVRPNLLVLQLKKGSDALHKISDELKETEIKVEGIDE